MKPEQIKSVDRLQSRLSPRVGERGKGGGVEEILFFSLICQVAWWRLIYSGDYSGGLRSLNQF